MTVKSLKHLLETNDKFLQVVIDAMPIPVFIKDVDGVYLGCNRAFETFVGLSREEMSGHTVHDLYPKEKADLFFQKDKALFDNPGVQIYEADISTITGQLSIVRYHKATYLDSDGRVAGLVGTIFDITHQKQLEERLEYHASHDYLTGLLNRRSAIGLLNQALDNSRNDGQPLSVMLLDVDHFKQLNDTHGHRAGDMALIALADYLQNCCEQEHTVARFGGEEFLIILPDISRDRSIRIAEAMRAHIERNQNDIAREWSLRVSIGIATSHGEAVDAETLIQQADTAMYRAKRTGRNRVCHDMEN